MRTLDLKALRKLDRILVCSMLGLQVALDALSLVTYHVPLSWSAVGGRALNLVFTALFLLPVYLGARWGFVLGAILGASSLVIWWIGAAYAHAVPPGVNGVLWWLVFTISLAFTAYLVWRLATWTRSPSEQNEISAGHELPEERARQAASREDWSDVRPYVDEMPISQRIESLFAENEALAPYRAKAALEVYTSLALKEGNLDKVKGDWSSAIPTFRKLCDSHVPFLHDYFRDSVLKYSEIKELSIDENEFGFNRAGA